MAKILVINGPDQGREFTLDDILVSIGRDPRNTIRLSDHEVSRIHAYIKETDAGYILADRNSSNGTFVNRKRVRKHKLVPQDIINVGKSTLLFDSRPVQKMVDVQRMVSIKAQGDPDGSASQTIRTIKGRVAMPTGDDDSQITDSFLDHLEENIHVIYHTAVATSRITDITELHQKVLELVFDWTKADRGCVLLYDQDTNRISPAAFRQRDELDRADPIQVSEDLLRRVAEKNEGVITSDTVSETRQRKNGEDIKAGSVLQSMCAPMHGRMGIVGFVYVDSVVPPPPSTRTGPFARKSGPPAFESRFTLPQLKMLLAISHQAALATENARYYVAMNRNAQLAAVGETFTQIAHHIRNMLQGIDVAKRRMNLGIDRKNWDMLMDGWREIEPLTSRIYELSLNLLSFSKPREPRLKLDSINDCCGDVIATVESRAQDRGVRLDWEPNFSVKPFFFDMEALYRAVLNVVQNALDATTLGCVVKIRVTESEGAVNVSVIDDGVGIDPRKLELIFQPFATTKGELGTGVGLPVTRKILREHGGDVTVSSSLGNGSSFTLSLPARRTRNTNDDSGPKTSGGEKLSDT